HLRRRDRRHRRLRAGLPHLRRSRRKCPYFGADALERSQGKRHQCLLLARKRGRQMGETGMIRSALSAAALIMLAACVTPDPTYRDLDQMGRDYQRDTQGSPTPQNAEPATAADVCHASRFRALIGQPAASIDRSTLPPHTRIISPGMMITQDFSPERLNIR